MLHYAIVFLVIALIAAVLGFSGVAAGAAGIAKILFVVFLILAIAGFVFGRSRGYCPWSGAVPLRTLGCRSASQATTCL